MKTTPRPPLILVHGAGGGAWQWQRWGEILAKKHWPLEMVELRPSPAGLVVTTFEDYLQQLIHITRRCSLPPILMGASLGGLLALKVAQYVDVGALVLVNSVPPKGTPEWPPWPGTYPAVARWSTQSTLEGTRTALGDADEATVAWAQTQWRDESGLVLNALNTGIVVLPPAIPILSIIGGGDDEVPETCSFAMARTLKADAYYFAGAGHVGPLLGRRAGEIAHLVARWLDNTLKANRGR